MGVRLQPRRRARVLAVAVLTAALLLPLSAVEIVAWAEVPDVVASEVTFDTADRLAKAGGQLRSAPADADQRFSSVAFEIPEGAEVYFRVADGDGEWGSWAEVPLMDVDEGPDTDSAEAQDEAGRRFSDAMWVGDASDVQVQVDGARPEDVEATLIDTAGLNGAGTVKVRVRPQAADAATADGLKPKIVTRAQWGANESWRSGGPSYAGSAGAGVIHHTAGKNGYSAGDVPAILRGIYYYHTKSRGWSDIGYNFLVDRFGRIYEGRYGGMQRPVIGAHARGYNTGSIGVSVMGNFAYGASQVPQASLEAIADVLGWKFALHKIDPYGKYRHRNGKVTPTLIGHTDVGSTSCPGDIHKYLGKLKGMTASAMLPFRDVVFGGSHYDAIARLWADGLVNGCSPDLFCPWDTLTRAQAATMLSTAFGIPKVDGDRFRDVLSSSPHRRAINGMAEAGLIEGFADDEFRPNGTLKRSQLATILRRVLEMEETATEHYVDVPTRNPHFGSISALKDANVVGGCSAVSGGFCPELTVLRAQMSSMMSSALDWLTAEEEANRPLAGEPADTEARVPDVVAVPVTDPVAPGDDVGEGGGDDGGGEDPPSGDEVTATWEELVLAWLDDQWSDGYVPAGWPDGWDATVPDNWPDQWRDALRDNRWPDVWPDRWREAWLTRQPF